MFENPLVAQEWMRILTDNDEEFFSVGTNRD
jgi:hypothetical protein